MCVIFIKNSKGLKYVSLLHSNPKICEFNKSKIGFKYKYNSLLKHYLFYLNNFLILYENSVISAEKEV